MSNHTDNRVILSHDDSQMIDIDGILYEADDYYYWEHLQACLHEEENEDAIA